MLPTRIRNKIHEHNERMLVLQWYDHVCQDYECERIARDTA